jgi:hypothetical protein
LRIITFVIFAGTVYFGVKANQNYKLYHFISDEDEERVDKLYKKMYRNLEYATISFNVAVSLTLLNLDNRLIMKIFEENKATKESAFIGFEGRL